MRTLDLFENSDYNEDASLEEAGYRNYNDNRTGFAKPKRDVSGEGEPQGMFTVVINGRPWKEFTSNKAFSVAKTIATKYPDKKVQVKWPTGQLNTIKEQGIYLEDANDSPVASAITRRILLQRSDLLTKYGPEAVTQAIDDVTDFVGDVDEIGSSDVSGWVRHVEQMLGKMNEGEISQNTISKMNKPNQEFYGKNPHFTRGAEVKNVGKTVDATGKPVSALATKVTPQFNKPAPVKKLRATSFEESASDLQQRISTLESAMIKARNLTKSIKYDGTVTDILVGIRQLAENAGIDARDLEYAENEVFDAKKQLESAVYGLDEIFEDAIQSLQYQLDSED